MSWAELVVLALWGWPGALLVALAAAELVERAFRRRLTVRGRWKLALAGAVLAVGLATTYLGLRSPSVAEVGPVGDLVERAGSEKALEAQAEALRRELPAEPVR